MSDHTPSHRDDRLRSMFDMEVRHRQREASRVDRFPRLSSVVRRIAAVVRGRRSKP